MRSILVVLLSLPMALQAQNTADLARQKVDPFIGTGGHGHTFPGACVPNGLVQLSPDTRPDPVEWDGCGGYHYSDSLIYGFSHTHLSGTGVADLCDVLLMPMSGGYALEPADYRASFSHNNESAHAGYYRVHLDGKAASGDRLSPGIDVELTATPRVGVHRYAFPAKADAYVVLDLKHRDKVTASSIQVVGGDALRRTTEITGSRRSSSWAGDQQLYFCMRFSKPAFALMASEEQMGPTPQLATEVEGTDLKAVLGFGDLQGEALVVKVGISAVSVEGARANLDAEVPDWDFDKVKQQAEKAWNEKLNKIKVKGGSPEEQRTFYTALYHSYIAPCIFNDVDSTYRGMDGEVHKADHDVYTVFSLWDTFRGLHPLMTILEPEMTSDWIKTFLLHYQQGGKLPVWELWGNETDCMIGYHSVPVIADAYLKGIRDFDVDLAMEAMVASAMGADPCLDAYRSQGYISSEDCAESVSKTLEYAYDDACIERMRQRMKTPDTGERPSFAQRSRSYESLFDPASGFFRARRNGAFLPGFDPYEVNFHFTEANAWQYSLFVPHHIDDLIALHGGEAGFEAFLDKLFHAETRTTGREQADITGLIGQYAHGNEPSHHMAYLYDRVGRPDKTRQLVKRIMNELYHDAPDGLSGNEDCGQMSAWYVLSALGIYPLAPGIHDRYELGHLLFDEAVIGLPNGREWRMAIAPQVVPKDTTELQGHTPEALWHQRLKEGGELLFTPERAPHRSYRPRPGLTVLDGAYVRSKREERPGAPVVQADAQSFLDDLEVKVSGRGTCTVTDATGTRPCPTNSPFTITASSTVSVDWSEVYAPVTARFFKIDQDLTIALETPYANQYAAGGPRALVDGIRGGADYRTGEWQGFQGHDVLATIDLGRVKQLDSVGVGMLQDMKSWIWYPEFVDVAWSTNKRMWSSTKLVPNESRQREGGLHRDVWTGRIGKKARYVKIMARNAGPCPPWHPGAGGESWIFLDEVLIKAH